MFHLYQFIQIPSVLYGEKNVGFFFFNRKSDLDSYHTTMGSGQTRAYKYKSDKTVKLFKITVQIIRT